MDRHEAIRELELIAEELEGHVHDAKRILRQVDGAERLACQAVGYWMAHILGAVRNESGYTGGSMVTMEDTIRNLRELGPAEVE